jgi:hypothetical protein
MKLTFGTYKNTKISEMTSPQQVKYLHWLLNSQIKISEKLRNEIKKHLGI